MRTLSLDQAREQPFWRRPVTLLFVMAAAMPISFATWSALLNNFVIEAAGCMGRNSYRLASEEERGAYDEAQKPDQGD